MKAKIKNKNEKSKEIIKNLVVSVSGGKTSALLAWYIKISPKYKDYNKLFIFANTGKERPETLDFLNQLDKKLQLNLVWVEAVVTPTKGIGIEAIQVNYQTASQNGEPFEAVISLFKGVPSVVAPYCSEQLKKIPINKYAKQYFKGEKYLTAIGFRYEDMPKRVSKPELHKKYDKKIYPLLEDFDHFITKKEIDYFWSKQSFNLSINSVFGNCDLCWKKSNLLKIKILKNEPLIASWWVEMEQKYKGTFHYGNKSTLDLLKASKVKFQLDLFDNLEIEGCLC